MDNPDQMVKNNFNINFDPFLNELKTLAAPPIVDQLNLVISKKVIGVKI